MKWTCFDEHLKYNPIIFLCVEKWGREYPIPVESLYTLACEICFMLEALIINFRCLWAARQKQNLYNWFCCYQKIFYKFIAAKIKDLGFSFLFVFLFHFWYFCFLSFSCKPMQIQIVEPVVIVDIHCGNDGTMFLTETGAVLACGSNRNNKLGLNNRQGFLMAMKNIFNKVPEKYFPIWSLIQKKLFVFLNKLVSFPSFKFASKMSFM